MQRHSPGTLNEAVNEEVSSVNPSGSPPPAPPPRPHLRASLPANSSPAPRAIQAAPSLPSSSLSAALWLPGRLHSKARLRPNTWLRNQARPASCSESLRAATFFIPFFGPECTLSPITGGLAVSGMEGGPSGRWAVVSDRWAGHGRLPSCPDRPLQGPPRPAPAGDRHALTGT